MIKLSLRGAHTGDILMALPAIGGLLARGDQVGVVCDPKYSAPINVRGVTWLNSLEPAVTPNFKRVHRSDAWLRHFAVEPKRVPLANAGQAAAEQLLPGKGWCVLSPWADHPAKRWSPARWTAIASRAARIGYRVAVVGPQSASQIGHAICRDAMAIDLVGKCMPTTWPSLLERAHVVISPDTGAVHMADALGVPVIGLYGATAIDTFGPYWNRTHCVEADGMASITADMVGEQLEAIA